MNTIPHERDFDVYRGRLLLPRSDKVGLAARWEVASMAVKYQTRGVARLRVAIRDYNMRPGSELTVTLRGEAP